MEIENIKKNQSEIKNTITEIKNTLEESTIDEMKQRTQSAIQR